MNIAATKTQNNFEGGNVSAKRKVLALNKLTKATRKLNPSMSFAN
jgi:hypothetical protein